MCFDLVLLWNKKPDLRQVNIYCYAKLKSKERVMYIKILRDFFFSNTGKIKTKVILFKTDKCVENIKNVS